MGQKAEDRKEGGDELSTEARDLAIFLEASTTIMSSLDLETVLRTVAEQMLGIAGVEVCAFSRWDITSNTLRTLLNYSTSQVRIWQPDQPGTIYQLEDYPLTARVLQERTSAIVHADDPRDDLAERTLLQQLGIQSALMLPVIAYDRSIGVVVLMEGRNRHEFTQREIMLAQAMAGQAAIAIENARLFQEHKRRITELAILNDIGRALSSALDLDDLLETVQQQVSRIFDTTNFYIAAYEEGSDEWEILLEMDRGERVPSQRHKLGAGMTGHIIRNRQTILLRTFDECVAFDKKEGIELIGDQSKSWMGVPLISADKLVGVMAIQSYDEENLYDEEDLTLFSTIASQAAIAIENARLYHQLQEYAWQLSIPTIPVHDRVLVLPLVGTVDAERARRFTERLLEAVSRQRTEVVLLDITGVPTVDKSVAKALLTAAEATQLLGAEVVLVGIRTEVAQTLVKMGLGLESLATKANLQAGIEYALRRLGKFIVSVD